MRKLQKRLLVLLTVIFLFSILSGCTQNVNPDPEDSSVLFTGTEGFNGQIDHQPFFCYNDILYMTSPSLGSVYTELPEGYSYVGETVNVGTIFGLKEMESNVSGSIYKNDSTSDYALISFPGEGYDDGLTRYILCIPCED